MHDILLMALCMAASCGVPAGQLLCVQAKTEVDEKQKRRSESESAAAAVKSAAKEADAAESSEPVPFERPVSRFLPSDLFIVTPICPTILTSDFQDTDLLSRSHCRILLTATCHTGSCLGRSALPAPPSVLVCALTVDRSRGSFPLQLLKVRKAKKPEPAAPPVVLPDLAAIGLKFELPATAARREEAVVSSGDDLKRQVWCAVHEEV